MRAQALDRRDGRARAGLGIEAVRAAATAVAVVAAVIVLSPVGGRDVLVRAGHLHAAVAADGVRPCAVADDTERIRPLELLLDVEIHLLRLRRRRIVAAVQPLDHAGVAAQPVDLIAQRCRGDRRSPAASTWPSAPSGRSSTSRPSPGCLRGRHSSKNSAVSSLPSRRIVFSPMSRT